MDSVKKYGQKNFFFKLVVSFSPKIGSNIQFYIEFTAHPLSRQAGVGSPRITKTSLSVIYNLAKRHQTPIYSPLKLLGFSIFFLNLGNNICSKNLLFLVFKKSLVCSVLKPYHPDKIRSTLFSWGALPHLFMSGNYNLLHLLFTD